MVKLLKKYKYMGIENFGLPINKKVLRKEQRIPAKRQSQEDSSKLSRRDFLKKAVVAGGAFTAGVLVGKYSKEDEDLGLELESQKPAELEFEPKTQSPTDSNENKTQEPSEPNKEKKQELKGAEKIVAEILRTYNLPAVARRFDPKIFTKDFVMAQQFQESRYDKKAKSSSEAQGVYQNKPESIQEVVKYLDFLRAKKKVDYNGPKEISLETAEKIGDLFKEKVDYGRATGKLYLLAIHDKESKYNDGNPNSDIFRGKSPIEQQKLLLIAYHDGPSRRYHPERATKNCKKYVELVSKHKEVIRDIRNRLERAGMSREFDYVIIKIMKELDRPESLSKKDKVINYWLKKLQDAHIAMWNKTGKYEEKLKDKEIWNIFPKEKRRV